MNEIVLIIQKTIIYAIPLLVVALGGCIAEKSGVINLSLEGGMIFGSFTGAVFVYILQTNDILTDNQQLIFLLALIVSGIGGILFSLLLSVAAVNLKGDQTIGGTALNMLAPAIVVTFCTIFLDQEKLVMPYQPHYAIVNPDMNALLKIFFDKAYISTYICLAVYIVVAIWLYKSKVGTHLRACGEHPQAADAVGINVKRMRYLGTSLSGFLSGLGGYAYIATVSAGTAENSVQGMGFLALAIMIFGNWHPVGIALGAFLFGFLKCIGPISSVTFLGRLSIPPYVYNIIPYLIVIIVLIITRKKSGCPKAEGIPYEKSMR